ncbi:hypothetical protein CYY_001608 [Polysphondylium violaceum]|uniref:Transmembrane protein n=1 Tax=Polysphondylium violaceum TaxID=133409 RepID=A0A8J4VAG1_9MYCE|nr:hypothetical protein CYY_001608 [Polysphondylium violaceum]
MSLAKAACMTVLFFAILLSVAVIGFSVKQIKNTSNITDLEKTACTNVDIIQPFRYTVGEYYVFCSWSTKNSAIRILIALGGALIGIGLFATVLARKKVLSIVFNVVIFILGGFGIYSTIVDAQSTINSKKFCKNIIGSLVIAQEAGAECSYEPIYITIVLNVFNGLLLMITSILIFRFRSKVITGAHHKHPVVDDIDYNYKYPTQAEAAVEEKQNLI